MKHLFFVHTCITYIASLLIVNQLGLSEGEVMLLFRQRLKVEHSGNIELRYVPDIFEKDSFEQHGLTDRTLNYTQRKKIISVIDSVLDDFIHGAEFTAYVPHTLIDLIQLIITHKCCTAVAIVEEGLLLYSEATQNYLPWLDSSRYHSTMFFINKLLRYRLHLDRLMAYRSYQPFAPIPVFAFAPDFVQPHPLIDVVKLNNNHLVNTELGEQWSNTSFFFFSPEVEDNLTDWDSYRQTLQLFLEYYSEINTSVLWVKFHPRQKLKAEILAVLNASKVRYKIFPYDKCVEFMLYSSNSIISYGFVSSLLLYTSLSGNTGYSLLKILRQFDKEAFPRLPQIFYEYVILL